MDILQTIVRLFHDCGFDGADRRAWLQREYGRLYVDELADAERHEIIERLERIKDGLGR
jgi:hypothetical protein